MLVQIHAIMQCGGRIIFDELYLTSVVVGFVIGHLHSAHRFCLNYSDVEQCALVHWWSLECPLMMKQRPTLNVSFRVFLYQFNFFIKLLAVKKIIRINEILIKIKIQ